MTRYLSGRLLLSATAVFATVGSFVADWNTTHMFNAHWPPHARFHGAQTLATAVVLPALALSFLWRRSGDRQTNSLAAVMFTGTYFWTQAAAVFFPGVAWIDPEFLAAGETVAQFPPPQVIMDAVVTAVVLLSAWLLLSGTNDVDRAVRVHQGDSFQ